MDVRDLETKAFTFRYIDLFRHLESITDVLGTENTQAADRHLIIDVIDD